MRYCCPYCGKRFSERTGRVTADSKLGRQVPDGEPGLMFGKDELGRAGRS